MKRIASFIVKFRYWISGVILAVMVASLFLMGQVSINYNISDYLDESTGTKKALTVMEEEFSLTGNIQVMLENISPEEAKEVKKQLETIEGVLTVSFDAEDENSYRDGTALFVLITEGDDYSAEGTRIVKEVKSLFAEDAFFGGSTVDKTQQRETITFQIPIILALCILIAYIILVFTTGSWLEPILFLLTAGVAVFINRGTNLIFGSISYITNSIAAILQLALALDYSIMLLHSYHKKKETISAKEAMTEALAESMRPVSASALTTMAGLLALLFMSFTIGFDIGMVLMKGIVISAIVAFTLFPCVILLCSGFLDRTKIKRKKAKKVRHSPVEKLAFASNRWRIPVSIFACLLIAAGFVVQSFSVYTFSDQSANIGPIVERFGDNSALVLVYQNGEGTREKQDLLVKKLEDYTIDGYSVLKSYTAYTNTVLEEYDVPMMVKKLELTESDAENLFALYHLHQNPDGIAMRPTEFLNFTQYLLREDEDAKQMASEETSLTVRRLASIYEMLDSYQTADVLYQKLTAEEMKGFLDVDEFYVRQAYGMASYDKVRDKGVSLKEMLSYLIESSETNDFVSGLVDPSLKEDLIKLQEGIETFVGEAAKPLTQEEFKETLAGDYGVALSSAQVSLLFRLYGGLTVPETVPFLPMLAFLDEQGFVKDQALSEQIQALNGVYERIEGLCTYETFFPVLSSVVEDLTGTAPEIDVETEAVRQLYILYFYDAGRMPALSLRGIDLVETVLSELEKSEFLAENVSSSIAASLKDAQLVWNFLDDKTACSYPLMAERIQSLQREITSQSFSEEISEDLVSGVYLKRQILAGTYDKTPIAAKDLLRFIQDNRETNELLSDRITEEMAQKIDDAEAQIEDAEELFLGEHYTRVIFNVDLPTESEHSYAFAAYVNELTEEIFGGDAYMAGEIMSTYDLRESFSHDRLLISVFTLVSIFLIVLLTFRSLSVPALLVLVIQGSIWICLSAFVVSASPVFFMSYIVASCILMGATIDYGILMSSTYVNARKKEGREESLRIAVTAAMPTILSSGLVLMCCGFIIFFIIEQVSIATVGLLIGIGTLCSMLMIVFLLPAILALFDKVILYTTLGARPKKTEKEAS